MSYLAAKSLITLILSTYSSISGVSFLSEPVSLRYCLKNSSNATISSLQPRFFPSSQISRRLCTRGLNPSEISIFLSGSVRSVSCRSLVRMTSVDCAPAGSGRNSKASEQIPSMPKKRKTFIIIRNLGRTGIKVLSKIRIYSQYGTNPTPFIQ